MSDADDLESGRNKTAEFLRKVADDLESDDLQLTEHPRIAYHGFGDTPAVVELAYYDYGHGERRVIIE